MHIDLSLRVIYENDTINTSIHPIKEDARFKFYQNK